MGENSGTRTSKISQASSGSAASGAAEADMGGIIANAAKNVCNRAFLMEILNMIKEMGIPQAAGKGKNFVN